MIPKTSKPSHLAAAFILCSAVLLGPTTVVGASGPELTSEPYPKLRLLTDGGEIEIELFTDAAPEATRRLLALSADDWTDLSLWEVFPRSRVISSEIPRLANPPVPMEIDADSLGLDRQVILDRGAAMNVVQDELMAVHLKNKQSPPTETFRQWIEVWRAERKPDFLLGLDRKQLFQGFGVVFQEGLASRPVERGSVLLRPASPEHAEPRLVFSLGDRPLKTGRWMVIGRVTQGLDLLVELSVAPLSNPVAKSGRLARPARVRSITVSPGLPGSPTALGFDASHHSTD